MKKSQIKIFFVNNQYDTLELSKEETKEIFEKIKKADWKGTLNFFNAIINLNNVIKIEFYE